MSACALVFGVMLCASVSSPRCMPVHLVQAVLVCIHLCIGVCVCSACVCETGMFREMHVRV